MDLTGKFGGHSASFFFFSQYIDWSITEDFNELKQVYNTVISTIFIHDFNTCTLKINKLINKKTRLRSFKNVLEKVLITDFIYYR